MFGQGEDSNPVKSFSIDGQWNGDTVSWTKEYHVIGYNSASSILFNSTRYPDYKVNTMESSVVIPLMANGSRLD